MKETLEQTHKVLRDMWRRRWIGLAVAWIAALAGIVVVFRIPERFEAGARVFVDTESLLKPILAGVAIQPNLDQQVSLISRTLISRPNVERVVRMADLDHAVTDEESRTKLVDEVLKRITLSSATATNLYQIRYRDSDPNQARRVVQSLLTLFMESSLGDKQQDSRAAIRFLDEQIKHYEASLLAAENRLKDFKLKYIGVSGGPGGSDYFARVAELRTQMESARLELSIAQRQRDTYRKELQGEQPTFAFDETPVDTLPEYDVRLAALRKDLDEQRRKYTDQHPEVQSTQRIIAQLEGERAAELDKRRKAAGATRSPRGLDRNPLFQQLRMSLAEAEAAVASASAKLAGYEAKHQQLAAQAKLVPQVEAELAQLNRDYDVQKKTYETLLARRESATMGIGVQDSGGAQFRVIDPPRVSPYPVAPNRPMLLGVALLGALGLGVLAAFLASQIAPTFHDARALREIAQRPVLGMVSMLPSRSNTVSRRRGIALFASGVSGLFALYAAVATIALLAWRAAAS